MAGPWEQYQDSGEETGPWSNYAEDTAPEKPKKKTGYSFDPSLDNILPNAKSLGKGALRGASRIGNTLINAATFIPRKIADSTMPNTLGSLVSGQKSLSPISQWNNERQAGLEDFSAQNAGDPYFTGGDIGGLIAKKEIPRQLGLATRYGLEGLADTGGIFSDPLAVTSNKLLGTKFSTLRDATSGILDSVGFPKPENSLERIVAEGSRLLSGTGGIIKSATKVGAKVLASKPGLQASSALGAGILGGAVKEDGGNTGEQLGAAVVGGIGAPLGVAGISSVAKNLGNTVKGMLPQIQLQIDDVIKQAGLNTDTLSTQALNSLRSDVQKVLQTGNDVSPEAIRRLADYRAVNATPMRGNLTLNPVDVTRDRNLAKLGANSYDSAANQLPMIQNQNNRALITGLNDLGANTADDTFGAGSKIIGALNSRDTQAKSTIGSFYDKARATDGRSAKIDHVTFTNTANNLLDDALLGGKLPADVRNLLNNTAQGKMPLTVDVAEQFKTRIGALQRASNDPAERMALGKVREALDSAPLMDGQGQNAINAFNKARKVNSSYMRNVENTPALQAVRDGVEPDKFVSQFIVGNGSKSNLMDLAMLKKNIKGNKEAMGAVRGQILAHLKGKGVNGAADEVANFSPAGYNKALEQIGQRKLNLFFDKSEIEQLNRIGRVASYENFQPKGSAVNNSNTAAALFSSVIDGIGKYIPLGKAVVADPVRNITLSVGARKSLSAPNAITATMPKQELPPPLWPLLGGGLLGE